MNGSRYRLCLCVAAAVMLTLGASSCSKKDNNATTSTGASTTAPTTTAVGGKGTTTVAGTPGSNPKANACGTWPKNSGGMPAATKDAASAGYFVWQDYLGWHVRARGTASKEPFKGTLRGSRDMTSVKEFPAGSGTKVDLKGNLVTFEIPASAALKGFDLVAGCRVDQLQFTLLIGSSPAPADSIFVGGQGKAVSAVFVQQKS